MIKFLSFVDRDDTEGREMLWRTFYFLDELKKIGLTKGFAEVDEEKAKEFIQQFPYLFEDLTKTIEEGKQKWAEYEELINSNRLPAPPNQEKTNEKISQLEAEKKRLQGEIDRVKNDSRGSEDERKRKQAELEKELAAREAEIASLRQGQKTFPPPQKSEDDNSKKKNNNKLNWAIGLGIVAIVIALLFFIVLLARPRRRD